MQLSRDSRLVPACRLIRLFFRERARPQAQAPSPVASGDRFPNGMWAAGARGWDALEVPHVVPNLPQWPLLAVNKRSRRRIHDGAARGSLRHWGSAETRHGLGLGFASPLLGSSHSLLAPSSLLECVFPEPLILRNKPQTSTPKLFFSLLPEQRG